MDYRGHLVAPTGPAIRLGTTLLLFTLYLHTFGTRHLSFYFLDQVDKLPRNGTPKAQRSSLDDQLLSWRKNYHERSHVRNNNKFTTEVYVFKKEEKNIDKMLKQKNDRRNQIRIQEEVMRGEGINTSHIGCTQ